MVSNEDFENLIQDYLPEYRKQEPEDARQISHALPKWRKSRLDWLTWWKQQSLELRMDMQKFLFWLARQNKIRGDIFEFIYFELTPQKTMKNVSVSLVESGGTPKFEGGIIGQEWTLCKYSFKSASEAGKWDVSYQTLPDQNAPTNDLDLVLSALSFEVRRNQRIAKIGFIPYYQQEVTQSHTEAVFVGLSPTVHTLPEIDFGKVEKLIDHSKKASKNGLSVDALLRVRHRAITDSSDESKLITLWGVIDKEFGDLKKSEKLLDKMEKKKLKEAIRESIPDPDKQKKVFCEITKLNKKTKNAVIKEEIKTLQCSIGHDVDKEIQSIVDIRGPLAHGTAINPSQRLELLQGVTFLFTIVDELIENKLTELSGS